MATSDPKPVPVGLTTTTTVSTRTISGGYVYTTGAGQITVSPDGYSTIGYPALPTYPGLGTASPPFAPQPGSTSVPGSLSAEELSLLLGSHQYTQWRDTEYCLFCFALNHFRKARDHDHVIHEE